MTSVVDFVCIRIQDELIDYRNSNTIPKGLTTGVYGVDNIYQCIPYMSPKIQNLAVKLINHYTLHNDIDAENHDFIDIKEYSGIVAGLETQSADFKFPTVLSKYRSGINPVTAIYHELKEITGAYDKKNKTHDWLLSLVKYEGFNELLIDSLNKDIATLTQYANTISENTDISEGPTPIVLLHAKSQIIEFTKYIKFFENICGWCPLTLD